ncbi:MAG TPA: phenylalanine--tRNA ligase subunit beta [Solirubrobacteraceae bacterium]|jgi:phenylalanyl-tRNA synthetase beta chain
MRVPVTWLREYCDPDIDVAGIEERLTMTGTKVEAIHHQGVPSTENFVIGRVLSAEPHPDADRLKVCAVELGEDAPATIVCGAPNVAAGQTVAVARPGAVMPDGAKLKQAKLRGVVSEGMILAASELEIGAGNGGIMVLDDAMLDADRSTDRRSNEISDRPAGISDRLAPGTPLADVLPIATEVIELEVTPNRPDCLGVYGVARELHAATWAPLAPEPWREDPGSPGAVSDAQVSVECPDLCPRFTARVFENVTIAPSPPWLAARLSAAGQRPINNVVDITNYAMLLTGQPLHAFDLDRVAGARLTVRRAAEGEQVATLDGQTRTLDAQMVVIEDAEGPTSIAGLMGGARSEVQPETTRVLLEVANWHGPNIHRSSWALGLRSEASSRFEKGLAPEQCLWAQAIATRLMIECCGASVAPGTIDIGGEGSPPPAIGLREARVRAILGIDVSRERQAQILSALDFRTVEVDDGLQATPPPVRREDVTREIDLIEEVARIDGLERLPITLPARRGAAGRLTHAQRVRRAAEDALAGRGLHEIVGWSFAEPALLDRLLLEPGHPLRSVVKIENPLSEDQSIMRPTLLGSLLDVARHNVARNGPDLAIFESGAVYRAADEDSGGDRPADEHHALGALLVGELEPVSWRGGRPGEADFFAVKALLGSLLERFHVHWSVREAAHWPFLHPGRSAEVLARGPSGEPSRLGFLGELHPRVAENWDLGRTATFAIDLGILATVAPEVVSFTAFGPFPALRQDLAVTLPVEVSARELLHLVRKAGAETLETAEVFDVYTGAQVGEGKRSLALALSFRVLDRTLTDEDVAPVRERILAALAELGGELRG